jgi:hypothetical protein
MVRYFLNLFHGDDDLPNDPEPQEFPNLKAAQAEAIASLREISTYAEQEYDGIEILSEDGRPILSVPMAEALKSN